MALSALEGSGPRRQEDELEDEFVCPSALRGALLALQPSVERVFAVKLLIGGENAPSLQSGQMWLQLRGSRAHVSAAKLFIKGVVYQEDEQKIQFPEVLYCVFCGAKGLFMDCLIKITSAQIVVGSQDCAIISGLAEPVVKAYSFISDLVEKCRSNQRGEVGFRPAGESRRAFKELVEGLSDRHEMDLLVLPVTVKEALLDLVKQSGLDPCTKLQQEGAIPVEGSGSWAMGRSVDEDSNRNSQTPPFLLNGTSADFRNDSFNPPRGYPLDPRCFEFPGSPERSIPEESEAEPMTQDNAGGQEEFQHLLKFFTAMGYTENTVSSVLARTGLKEASQLLDLIQQEQDRNGRGEDCVRGGAQEARQTPETRQTPEENSRGEDFVLGVLKAAAATCGYTEERVTEAYRPELTPHQLLLQLQKQMNGEPGANHSSRDSHSVVDTNPGHAKERETEAYRPKLMQEDGEPDTNHSTTYSNSLTDTKAMSIPNIRGPPQTTYSFSPEEPPRNSLVQSPPRQRTDFMDRSIAQTVDAQSPPRWRMDLTDHTVAQTVDARSPPRRKMDFMNHTITQTQGSPRAAPPVTGPQRFLESLNTPFKLELTDEAGDPELRQIIIDGSNVAMSHGLGFFFSCRGIALAVQHFWSRGHREITVFVPQWRQKYHSKIKEKKYMTELHNLGFLSYTPSREVEGKRINSYDDRFLLALAQKTNGVIVTNDNLRDLVDESPAWRDIIKKSLLQYVFAGDLFMLPDDPLGRGGPHLRDFLHKHKSSSPVPGSHSFAGVSATSSPALAPRPHTDVLPQRNWTPGGRGRGQEVRERTTEETLKLRQSLVPIFPDQESLIIMILQSHPAVRDVNRLTDLILEQQE